MADDWTYHNLSDPVTESDLVAILQSINAPAKDVRRFVADLRRRPAGKKVTYRELYDSLTRRYPGGYVGPEQADNGQPGPAFDAILPNPKQSTVGKVATTGLVAAGVAGGAVGAGAAVAATGAGAGIIGLTTATGAVVTHRALSGGKKQDAAAIAGEPVTQEQTNAAIDTLAKAKGVKSSDLAQMLANMNAGGTAGMTEADKLYLSRTTGGMPLDPASLATIDRMGGLSSQVDQPGFVYGGTLTRAQAQADRRTTSADTAARRSDLLSTQPVAAHTQIYSLRQAVDLPYRMKPDELQETARKLFLAGYLNLKDYDITKPFDDQYLADPYDSTFQSAWQTLVSQSFTDPSKTATQILEERIQRRTPLFQKALAEASKKKVQDALRSVNLTGVDALRTISQDNAERILHRRLNPDEEQQVAQAIRNQELDQAKNKLADKPVENVDPTAAADQQIRKQHGVEQQAVATADMFHLFAGLLGPGGGML